RPVDRVLNGEIAEFNPLPFLREYSRRVDVEGFGCLLVAVEERSQESCVGRWPCRVGHGYVHQGRELRFDKLFRAIGSCELIVKVSSKGPSARSLRYGGLMKWLKMRTSKVGCEEENTLTRKTSTWKCASQTVYP
ncbi:hypothetical protein CH063_05391, partial [Colletotrichum higginsianum]